MTKCRVAGEDNVVDGSALSVLGGTENHAAGFQSLNQLCFDIDQNA